MKKQLLMVTLAILMVLGLGVNAEAAEIDLTMSVSATATVGEDVGLSISPASITFGDTSADKFPTIPAGGKIVITYKSNYDPWKLAIYTDNTQVKMQAAGGKYAKGGLATADGKYVVACKWVCQDDATAAPNIANIGGYNFIKDKRDEDDPATAGQNESWATAFADGYANIAFGAPGNASPYSWCVDPTNSPTYHGDPTDGTIAVYVAGMFGTGGVTPPVPASAGIYTSNIYFDLYHE